MKSGRFSGGIDWGQSDIHGNPLQLARSASNHLALVDGEIVMVAEKYFQRLWVLKDLPPPAWRQIARRLQQYLKMPDPIKPANRIEIHRINNAAAADSPWAGHLLQTGFEKDDNRLVLWPSAI